MYQFVICIIVFASKDIRYWEYYGKKNDNLMGWSSYFIHDGIYYDFLCSPNSINISVVLIHSIKYCINNSINILDLGPTNCQFKIRKFNAKLVEF